MLRRILALSALCAATGSAAGCTERLIREGLDGDGGGDAGELECGADPDCDAEEACFQGFCVGTGRVRFSLSWLMTSDLDLHLRAPDGTEINFTNPVVSWGHLDVDDCVDDECKYPDAAHVENVFLDEEAPRGEYEAWVENFNGSEEGDYRMEVVGDVGATWFGYVKDYEGARGDVHRIPW